MPDHVDAEAINALAQPEAHDVIDCFAYVRIAQVQVWLLGKERVIVILPGDIVELPGAAAEFREPVIGRPVVGIRIAPEVEVSLGVVARASRFDKPWMLIRGVVRNEVEDDLETPCVNRAYQRIEIGHVAKYRIDSGI